MQRIVPHLWYDTQAKEAAEFYVATFGGDSAVTSVSQLHDTPSGDVDVLAWKLWGYEFAGINAGPYFKFTPALSFSVQCKDEAEIDRLHAALIEGGSSLMPLDRYPWGAKYAWIADRYGLSWQLNCFDDQSMVKERIAPSFLFTKEKAGKAEAAMKEYIALFPDSKERFIARYEEGESEVDAPGTVKHAEFELFGQGFMALDSAAKHAFTFTEAVSLMVRCDTQEEIDRYWALSAVPAAEQCGWLKDRYGVSWQIVPTAMDAMMASSDEAMKARVTKAFLAMKKFDIAALEVAAKG